MSTNPNEMFPAAMLQALIGQQVLVRSKWGLSYVGTLMSTDNYMNLLLRDVQEQEPRGPGEAPSTAKYDDMLLRCNNILYIREVPAGQNLHVAAQ
jgi:small nuclear ribonucleoprotein (snRNP)-like protein